MFLAPAEGYAWEFVPGPRPGLIAIDDDTIGKPEDIAGALEAVVTTFRGEGGTPGYQTPWMGRGCFFALHQQTESSWPYLIAKGVGPGPGSEALRRMQEISMRSWHGPQSGCIRLDNGTCYPLLVKYVGNRSRWHAIDPRPEGMSSFGNLLREVCAARLLVELKLGVSSPRPLALLRHRVDAPWGDAKRSAVERYLLRRMPRAIDRDSGTQSMDLGTDNYSSSSGRVSPVFCHDLDGGLLIRAAKSPYRVANLHTAAIDDDAPAMYILSEHLRHLFNTREPTVAGERFTYRLAQAAAALFAEGMIHGQLHLHYHNISLAGEIADLDTAVFVRASLATVASIPFAGSLRENFYRRYWERLRSQSERWQIDLLAQVAIDARYRAGISLQQVDRTVLAASMLRQVYDIYLHAQRVTDLVHRVKSKSLCDPGTVLSAERIAAHRVAFRRVFLDYLDSLESRPLYAWCIENGYAHLQNVILDNCGRPTLYGWTCPDVPIDHSTVLCKDSRQLFIQREVTELLQPNQPD